MGIRVGYEPVGAIGTAANIGGQGRYRQWLYEQQQQERMQQQQLAAQAARQQEQIAAQQAAQNAQLAAQEAQWERQQSAIQSQLDAQAERDQWLHASQMQEGLYRQQLQNDSALEQMRLKYSAEDEAIRAKADKAREWIRNSDWSDDQKRRAYQQIDANMLGIKPTMLDDSDPNADWGKNSVVLPEGVAVRTPQGWHWNWAPKQTPEKPPKDNSIELMQAADKLAIEIMKQSIDDPTMTWEKAQAMADARYGINVDGQVAPAPQEQPVAPVRTTPAQAMVVPVEELRKQVRQERPDLDPNSPQYRAWLERQKNRDDTREMEYYTTPKKPEKIQLVPRKEPEVPAPVQNAYKSVQEAMRAGVKDRETLRQIVLKGISAK